MENLSIMTVHPLTSYDVIPLGTTAERERERDKTVDLGYVGYYV